MEIIKPLDIFLHHEAVSGFESKTQIPTALLGSQVGFPLFKELLHYYDNVPFLFPDGKLNQIPNTVIIQSACLEKGLSPNNTLQEIEGFVLYPSDYFCPVDITTRKVHITENTHAIHWFAGSWVSEERKRDTTLRANCCQIFGDVLGMRVYGHISAIKNEGVLSWSFRHLVKKTR